MYNTIVWLSEPQSCYHGMYWCQTSDSITTINCVPCEARTKAKKHLGNVNIIHRLRRLFAGHTLQFLGEFIFDLCWTKWQWDRFCSEKFGFLLSLSFHQCAILILIYMMLLPGGKTGEAWESSETVLISKSGSRIQENTSEYHIPGCVLCVLLSESEERIVHEANTNATWHNQVASFRKVKLTINTLMWKIWWASNNVSGWHMGFNSAFKGLTHDLR